MEDLYICPKHKECFEAGSCNHARPHKATMIDINEPCYDYCGTCPRCVKDKSKDWDK